MPNFILLKPQQQKRRRTLVVLLLSILICTLVMGKALAQSLEPSRISTIDPIGKSHQLGKELYLENCAGCHVALPPEVMPTETWRQLLLDPQHYGRQLQLPVGPPRILIWNYLRDFSRPHTKEEEIPYRLPQSRYFKALHPRVKLPRPTSVGTCLTCHPSADRYNFRQLAPEWQDSP